LQGIFEGLNNIFRQSNFTKSRCPFSSQIKYLEDRFERYILSTKQSLYEKVTVKTVQGKILALVYFQRA
jgi:hypothetical protein